MHFVIIFTLRFSIIHQAYGSTILDISEGTSFLATSWLDDSGNNANTIYTCTESKVGPFLGGFTQNFKKTYSNLPPHYQITLSFDILFGQYWYQIGNYFQILADGSQIYKLSNIYTLTFDWPAEYCKSNQFYGFSFAQQYYTIKLNFNHQSSNIQLQFQGTFDQYFYIIGNVNEQVSIKNLVIQTQDCDQSCLTCSGPSSNQCLTCQQGTPTNGVCSCSTGYIYQNGCVTNCPTYYVAQNNICQLECSLNCNTCSQSQCTSCIGYNVGGTCFSSCPAYSLNCEDLKDIPTYGSYYLGKYLHNLNLNDISSFSFTGISLSGQLYSIYNQQLILGGFGVWGSGQFSISYTNINPHNNIRIYAQLYFIDQWNGENIQVIVDGVIQYTNTFTSVLNTNNIMYRNYGDQIQNIQLSVPHLSDTLSIIFKTSLNQNSYSASAGITNLFILADYCDSNCQICGTTQCTTCSLNYNLIHNRCTLCDASTKRNTDCSCLTSYFDDGTNQQCQQCSSLCQQCNSLNVCTTCSDNNKVLPLCTSCKPGYYLSGTICNLCNSSCQTCSNGSSCILCAVGKQFNADGFLCSTPKPVCQSNQFVNPLNLCETCGNQCLTCTNNSQNCQTCTIDRINPPTCQCKSGYYSDTNNSSCLKCSSICLECENSSSNCTLCAGNRINIPTCDCPSDGVSRLEIGFVECSTCQQSFLKIQFSDDLNSIVIDFGKQLYQYQNCINLFSDITKFGSNPSCKINQHQVTLYLGQGASINVGDMIEFDQISFVGCSKFTFLNNNKILAPVNSLNPIVQFDQEDIIQLACDDININIINILNNGQRDLQYLAWTLQTTTGTEIQQLLSQQLGSPSYFIPRSTLTNDSTLQLKLTYQNFISQAGQTIINIQTAQFISLTPKLILPTIYTFVKNTIYVSINKQTCNEVIEQYEVMITISNNEKVIYQQVQSTQSYSTAFHLSEGQFLKDNNYSIQAEVTYKQQKYNLSDTFIPVDQKDYIVIKNGNRQVGFRQNFDISVSTSLNQSDFQWGCFIITNNKPCNIQLNNTNTQQILKSTFQVFQLIQFTVKQGNLESTAIINMIESEIPQIQVNTKQQYISRINNYYDELYFEIIYPIKINPELLFYYINLLFQDQQITFRVYYNQFKFRIWDYIGNQSLDQLQIQFNVFNPDFSVPSTASQQLDFNIPPQNCQIQHNDTIFNIIGCQDDDKPLEYQFVYYPNDQAYYFDQNKSVIIQGIVISNFSSLQQLNFNVPQNDSWMIIQVRDNFQGISNITIKLNQSSTQINLQTILENQIDINQLYSHLISYLLNNNTEQTQLAQIYNVVQGSQFTNSQIEQLKYLLYQKLNTSLIDITSDYNFINQQISITVQEYKQLYSSYTNYYDEVMKLNVKSTLQKQARLLGLLYDLNLGQSKISKRRMLFESQDIINQVDQLQSALLSSTLINEQAETIETNQFNTSIVRLTSSQYFNSKGNSSSIYQFGQTIYNNNPLQNTTDFRNFKQQQNTQLYFPTLQVDNQTALNYPSNYTFKNPQNNNQQCVIRVTSYWSADACQQQKKNQQTVCICQQVSPITIVEALQEIENQLATLFSQNAIENINNLQIQRLAFTYIILLYTIVYIAFVIIGNKLDSKESITPGGQEMEEGNNNKIYPIREIIINEDVQSESADQQIMGSLGDLKFPKFPQSMKQIQIQNSENNIDSQQKEGSQREIQFYPRRKQKQQTKISIMQDEERQSIERHDQTDIKSQFRSPNGIIRFRSNFSKMDQIKEDPAQKCIKWQIEQLQITERQAFVIFFKQWHDLANVYYRYDKNQSRIHRSTLVYISNIGQICILTVFGQTLSINTIIALSILQGLFRFMYKRIIQYLLNHQYPTLRVFGGEIIFLSTGIFFYLILASIAAYKDVITANLWAASYFGSFILNYFIYSSLGLFGYYILLTRFYKNAFINVFIQSIIFRSCLTQFWISK